jgi:hypothetical protein
MNQMKHAQHTKSFLGYGAGLLSLCLGATVILFTLQPESNDLNGIQTELSQQRKLVKVQKSARSQEPEVPLQNTHVTLAQQPEAPIPEPSVPREAEQEAEAQPTVEVIAEGRIRLTEEQAELIKGHGSSWGQPSPEAEAVLRAIPKEAFTSDW